MHTNHVDKCARPFVERASGGADAAVVVTIAADASQFWILDWIGYSYSGTPTGGRLTVAYGGDVLFEVDIADAGAGFIPFDHPLYEPDETKGRELTITLAAGGASVVGKLNVRGR